MMKWIVAPFCFPMMFVGALGLAVWLMFDDAGGFSMEWERKK